MSQNYNVLNNFDPNEFNLLIPVQSLQEINPIYRIVVNQVKISTVLADGEIYKEVNAQKVNNQDMYALTAKALMKLNTAANGQIVETRKVRPKSCEKCIEIVKATGQAPCCGNCPCNSNVAFQVTMKFPELSGGWRVVQATKEYDFSLMGNLKPGQVAKMKEHATEHVETKAMSRCIRKGLAVKNAYTLQELEKPFVVAYPVLDARDKDVKKALIAGAVAASNLLYGSNLQLSAPKQEALPAPQVDEDGVIIESDYDIEQPILIDQGIQNESEQTGQEEYICNNPNCNTGISEKVANFSVKMYGQALCYGCQQKMKGAKG